MASSNSLYVIKTIVGYIIIVIAFVPCIASQDIIPFKSSVKSLCEMTLYPTTCYHSLAPLIDSNNDLYDSLFLYKLSIETSITEVSKVSKDFSENGTITRKIEENMRSLISPLQSCRQLFSLALYNLDLSLPINSISMKKRSDFKTWLSASAIDLQTCIDGFEYAPKEVRKNVIEKLDNATKFVSNSLSIISKIDDHYNMGSNNEGINKYEDIKIMYDLKQTMKPNVVVAADGSGKYKTISEALNVVPINDSRRFVIYVKKGIYSENVKVEKDKWNVMMFGDGMENTIVSGNLNAAMGRSTFMTATFAVFGKGFIARDMGFRNTAGAAKFQAVALLSASDQSIFYRCKIDAYQDTLYTHSNRQFYRECKIYGTVDFIFGDASVVIQNTSILVKKPLPGQINTVTAQGKSTAQSHSGIVIQGCNILAAENLAGVQTFLGRPWGNFSTTIVMESELGSLIDPKGWVPWDHEVTAPDTVYYGEYNNRGPGAVTRNRIRWKGLRVNISRDEASKFTVRSFINGDQWIKASGVPFQPGL